MNLLIPRNTLQAALAAVAPAIPSRPVKPVLSCVKAVVAADTLTLSVTDLESGIRLAVSGVTCREPGECLLPASRLQQIVRELRDGDVAINATADAIRIAGDGYEFEMPGENADHFPDLPEFTADAYHAIPAATIREMIRRTAFAAAVGETARFAMTGVLWELDGDKARLVATDGKRLAVTDGGARQEGEHATNKAAGPLVPTRVLSLVERSLASQESEDATLRVCFKPNEVLFRTPTAVIYSRLVDGRFPDYHQVFPKKEPVAKVPLHVGTFQSSVRQAAIMADDESRRITLTFDAGKLTLAAQGTMTGRSKVEMPVAYDTGKPLAIGFKPQYLLDLLKVLDAESEVVAELVDGNVPVVFRCGKFFDYDAMPLSLS